MRKWTLSKGCSPAFLASAIIITDSKQTSFCECVKDIGARITAAMILNTLNVTYYKLSVVLNSFRLNTISAYEWESL